MCSSDLDATPFPRLDGGSFPDVGGPWDAGPPPIVACADASTAGGSVCPNPPSKCLDDNWLAYYYNGTCGDAGTCNYVEATMLCPSSPSPPDCYQGGCRIVLVR